MLLSAYCYVCRRERGLVNHRALRHHNNIPKQSRGMQVGWFEGRPVDDKDESQITNPWRPWFYPVSFRHTSIQALPLISCFYLLSWVFKLLHFFFTFFALCYAMLCCFSYTLFSPPLRDGRKQENHHQTRFKKMSARAMYAFLFSGIIDRYEIESVFCNFFSFLFFSALFCWFSFRFVFWASSLLDLF